MKTNKYVYLHLVIIVLLLILKKIKMRKLTTITLNKKGRVLSNDEMLKVLGGGSAYCHCLNVVEAIEVDTCSKCEDVCGSNGVQNCNPVK
ncbi:hypothetical protein LJC57_02455 [Parabacteroides sp. OttesenSCG-928-G07]|nr:hypothetical protein [Parabacteroides sp. OttesenSCG-928-G07]